MKKFFAALAMFFPLCAFCGGLFPLAGKSYIQRGRLSFGSGEIAITVYVSAAPDGSAKMLLQSQAGRLAKIELCPCGRARSCEGGALFPKRFAEKFALRDFRACWGMAKFLPKDARIEISRGAAAGVSYGGYSAEFSQFFRVEKWGCDVPRVAEIKCPEYTLRLEFAAPLEKN